MHKGKGESHGDGDKVLSKSVGDTEKELATDTRDKMFCFPCYNKQKNPQRI